MPHAPVASIRARDGRDRRSLALVKHLHAGGFTAIDVATHESVGTVGTGRQPHAVAIHPTGRWAYVPYMATGTVEVIDLRRLAIVDSVDAGTAPVGAALTPDGQFLLIGTYGPLPGTDVPGPGVVIFATDRRRGGLAPVHHLALGASAGIALDADDRPWIALKEHDEVVRLAGRGPAFSVAERVAVPAGPQGLRSAPDYGLLGVDCVDADAVAFVDTGEGTVRGVVDAPDPRTGAVLHGPDRWFVADTEGDGLAVIDPAAAGGPRVTRRLSLGTPTAFTDATPDGSLVVADAIDGDRVTFIDPVSIDPIARIRTGANPHHAQFTADGAACYVPNVGDDTITVLDTDRPAAGIDPIAEIAVSDGAGPSGCYHVDRRREP